MAFIVLVSIYSVLVLVLAFGFARLERVEIKAKETLFISVVVAVRNEDLQCDLSIISYPREKWELIIVDDSDVPLQRPGMIPSPSPGKKAAITAGVAAAKGEIIATTDADCRVHPLWLKEINEGFQATNVQMLVGGVRIAEGNSFFSRLQALEFVSVAATGAATLGLGIPTMSNGANLAYRREAFIEVNGYQGNENVPSGDDEFLMNKFNHKWKNSVAFLSSQGALVTTSPLPLVTSFIQQRLRWAGKWRHNISLTTRVFAMVVWFIHLGFIALPVAALTGIIAWNLLFILAGAKLFVESLFLIPAANFFQVKWRWISFFTLQFVYSFYVVAIGLTSLFLKPKWKGRAVESVV